MTPCQVTLQTTTDMVPVLRALMLEHRRAAGESTDITEQDVAQAIEGFGRQLDATQQQGSDEGSELEELKARLLKSLPKSVRVVELSTTRAGAAVTATTTFALDDVTLLPELEMFYEAGQKSQRPFAAFTIKREAGLLHIAGAPPEAAIATLSSNNTISIVLDLGVPATAHNATSTDGHRLRWVFDAASTTHAIAATFVG